MNSSREKGNKTLLIIQIALIATLWVNLKDPLQMPQKNKMIFKIIPVLQKQLNGRTPCWETFIQNSLYLLKMKKTSEPSKSNKSLGKWDLT